MNKPDFRYIRLSLLENNTGQIEGVHQNPRDLDEKGFEDAVRSIQTFPDMLEIRMLAVIPHGDKYIVIGGNQRLRALVQLHYEEAFCAVINYLSIAQINEFIMKDNIAYGKFNWDLIANDWHQEPLEEWGLPLPLDFKEEEYQAQADEDDVPEQLKEPISKVGDVWLLGKHRVMCGDSTNITDVEKLMDGKLADMVFTDPPYNTGMKANDSTRLNHMFNDSFTDEQWDDLLDALVTNNWSILKDDTVAYICLDWRRNHELIPKIKEQFHLSNIIVWDKMVHGLGSDYKYTYELINVCKKGKPELNTHQGDREYCDVWHIQRKMGRDDDHATKKPIELVERCILHGSHKEQLVLDLFGGSGSTLIACEKTNRINYTMELDPKYVDVIIKRWQQYTGNNAILESTKQSFNELCAD